MFKALLVFKLNIVKNKKSENILLQKTKEKIM